MMRKILDKHWNVLQINPELEETYQNYMFVAFKRNKNFEEIIGSHTIKCRKEFKAHLENRKLNMSLATLINHHYIARKFTVMKHKNYAIYFTISTAKVNSLLSK